MVITYPVELKVTLRPTDWDRPCKIQIQVPNDQRQLIIAQETTVEFAYQASGSSHLQIELIDQQAQEGVEIVDVCFFGIKDPRFAWTGVYEPVYPEPWASQQRAQGVALKPQLSSHTYLSWPGPWRLTFDLPVFTWMHRVQDLGWIFS